MNEDEKRRQEDRDIQKESRPTCFGDDFVTKHCDDMCVWCGKHIPAGAECIEVDEGNVYCSENCRMWAE